MTRAKDISKILTDANISGTLDVSGAFTSQGIDDNADATAITIDSSERIGIGLSSPAAPLHVQTSTDGTGLSGDDVYVARFQNQEATSDKSFGVDIQAGSSTTDQALRIKDHDGTNTLMIVDGVGNATVGVSSKNSANNGSLTIGHTGMTKITAGANGNADELVLIGANASANVGMSIISNNANISGVFFGDEDDTDIGRIEYYHSDNSMRFQTNTAERMRILSSGELLVGSSSDTMPTTASSGQGIQAGARAFIATETNGDTILGGTSGSNFTAIYQGGTERMRINSSGNVGVGTASPNNKLHVEGSEANVVGIQISNTEGSGSRFDLYALGSSPAIQSAHRNAIYQWIGNGIDLWSRVGDLRFGTSNSERMRIDSSGRMMIGTTTEGEQNADDLTVANTGHCGITIRSGTSAEGSLLFSDGTSGNSEYRGYVQYLHSSDSLRFGSGAAERMRITSSGNVGIGSSSPTSTSGGKLLAIETSADEETNLVFNTSAVGRAGIIEARRTGRVNYERFAQINLQNSSDNGILRFFTAGSGNEIAERFRCDEAGNINIGRTSTLSSSKVCIEFNGTNFNALVFKTTRSANGSAFLLFKNSSESTIGFIEQNTSSSTNYSTSSDYRLKENVSYDFDATTRLKQLKPCRFNFIADETNTLVDGFLAHEVSSIVPEAISGEKDALEDDGKIKPQGIDHGKIVPLLVKTIQELEARITTLEGA